MGVAAWTFIWTSIMPLAVILYYFFRKKYKDKRISSTLYWQELMQESQVSPFLKNFQRNILLYLQLAALLLLMFALLGPFLKTETLAGSDFIFIVDTSATMLAGSPSLFEEQKENMLQLIDEAGGKPVTIVTAGTTPETVIRSERDKERLSEAVHDLSVTYETEQIEQALYFTESLADSEMTSIHIFTDALDRSSLTEKSGQHITVHAQERTLSNVSIRQFGLATTADGARAVVQLVNDSESEIAGSLQLETGQTAISTDVRLAGGEERTLAIDDLPSETLWRAKLEVEDDYKSDNEAFAFMRSENRGVSVDAALHELIVTGFNSLGIRVSRIPSEQLDGRDELVVTNQTELLDTTQDVLLIGRDDAEAVEAAGKLETSVHPLFSYASLDELYVASLYPPFPDFQTVASIGGEPFIQISPEGAIAVLTDIEKTDWPLHPSFPLFLWSARELLAGTNGFLGFFLPNEQRAVAFPSTGGTWDVFKDEEYVSTYKEGEGSFKAPAEPGVYNMVGEEPKTFIVRLSNEEKELKAGISYQIGDREAGLEDTVRQSLVPWIVLLALLLLLVEWEVYRRGTANR